MRRMRRLAKVMIAIVYLIKIFCMKISLLCFGNIWACGYYIMKLANTRFQRFMPDFIGRLLTNNRRKTNAASRRLFFFCGYYIIFRRLRYSLFFAYLPEISQTT